MKSYARYLVKGADLYITKPVALDELEDSIHAAFDKRGDLRLEAY